ncbi:MAG: hypothetical protein GC178_04220 [Flavobacteriales bacterium]|nr:hypothetical protein [Flavobacteriales bacterium]
MRWNVLVWLLLSASCFGQEVTDSIPILKSYDDPLPQTPWNGRVISAMQNPAFAGFDRRLQFGYYYEGQNLKVPEGYDTKKAGFWNQTAIIDFAFGGKRKNIGVNISYNGGQRLISDYHRVQIAHSYRFHLRNHKFILGAGIRYLMLKGGSDAAAYGDMLDPRYGFVYPTQEFLKQDSLQLAEYSAGLIYNWKRLFLGYAFRYEDRSLLTAAGKDLHPVHHLNAMYTLNYGATGQFAAAFTAEYDGFRWYLEPALVVMLKNIFFLKFSSPNVSQFKTELGLQLWNFRAVYSCSFYFNQYAINTYGVASMSGGLRYHFQNLKSRKK